jgi:hypothetical protein
VIKNPGGGIMPEEATNAEHNVTTRTHRHLDQEAAPSSVQDWKASLQPKRTTGPAAAHRFARTHAVGASQEGCKVNGKLDCPGWHKPYAEALLATDPEILVKLLAATERAIFERLLALAAAEDVSDERQDIRCAIDALLALKAGKDQAGLKQIPHDAKAASSTRRTNRALHHNGKIEYRRFA